MNVVKGLQDLIRHEEIELDQLYIAVRMKKDDIIRTLTSEGFKKVKLENKMTSQIGSGFAKSLSKPWEMHVRLVDIHQQGLIAIRGEVEVSRRYIQHLTSVRCPVIYELESILKKHSIEYRIWNSKVRDYISQIIDDHQITLSCSTLARDAMEDNGVRCYDLGIVHYSEVFRNMEMNISLRPLYI